MKGILNETDLSCFSAPSLATNDNDLILFHTLKFFRISSQERKPFKEKDGLEKQNKIEKSLQ